MSRTYKTILEDNTEASFDIDLSPMLALMVTLIPIMLLSVVFVRVTVIETPLPQVVQKALEEDRKKKDREISIALTMNEKSGFQLQVRVDGKVASSKNLPKTTEGKWDLEGLHQQLVKVKLDHPKVFRLDLYPSELVPYDDIVKVMDEARNTKSGDPKLTVTDEQTKETVETDIMFPDVFFANVMEG